MDLLGSILGSMEKPPVIHDKDKKKAKELRDRLEKIQEDERKNMNEFKNQIQKEISVFMKNNTEKKHVFPVMDKIHRAIVHEVSEVAGLSAFSFGLEDIDRHIVVWKKEFAPSDDELTAYRDGRDYDPSSSMKVDENAQTINPLKRSHCDANASNKFDDRFKRLLEKNAGTEDDGECLVYGLVSSENKKDLRTIEQIMADNKERKRQRLAESEQHNHASSS